MSMQSMSVQTAQVSALAAEIRNGSQGIRSEIERLESEVGKLRGAWNGEAQNSYDAAQRQWTQSLGELQSLLERISSSTEQIAQAYNASDARNAGRFAG
ncbi:WXG100 family type VII secretion target [Leucobacter sp. USHLN153]|uniref:WXG100 family type VII secretion target n=1 Tax=Leucobacter sp. USHLN153 TaxID=3081268 RepID=UPI003FA59F38